MKLIIKLVHDYKELILHDVDRAKTLSTIPCAILTIIVMLICPDIMEDLTIKIVESVWGLDGIQNTNLKLNIFSWGIFLITMGTWFLSLRINLVIIDKYRAKIIREAKENGK